MSYKVLYRKYRPDDFDNVVGQEYTISMLKNAIMNKKTSHAYLFTGPRGTGKTSSAKIFAKALCCSNPQNGNPCCECDSCKSFFDSPDIIELDAASNNSVEDIREIINNIKLVPTNMKYKVYIIDEVHMLSPGAFNALLLTLEEPPEHVVFILATTEIQKVPITILSRCQRFDFKPINIKSIVSRLRYVSDQENINISDDALEEIAIISAGGMRDALGMLDQLSSSNESIDVDIVSSNFGSVSTKRIDEIIGCIENNDSNKLIEILGNIQDSGTNYTVFIDKLILELRKNAVGLKTGKYKHRLYYDDIYNLIFDLNELLSNNTISVNPYVLIEVVLLKYINKESNQLSTTNSIQNYFPGNNFEIKNDNAQPILGNNFDENKSNDKDVTYFPGNNSKDVDVKDKSLGNNPESLGNNLINQQSDDKVDSNISIDVNIRINNCFVDASKDEKKRFVEDKVNFLNYLLGKDRGLVSLLADISILAASNKYVLIQSKNPNTNALINQDIDKIEKYYKKYSKNDVRFAAVNDDLWKKEVENYRINKKNKIQYTYMEESVLSTSDKLDQVDKLDVSDIENVAKEIFDSYEIVE